ETTATFNSGKTRLVASPKALKSTTWSWKSAVLATRMLGAAARLCIAAASAPGLNVTICRPVYMPEPVVAAFSSISSTPAVNITSAMSISLNSNRNGCEPLLRPLAPLWQRHLQLGPQVKGYTRFSVICCEVDHTMQIFLHRVQSGPHGLISASVPARGRP